jgi:hypothetical protein
MDPPVPLHRLDLYRVLNDALSEEGRATWEADVAYLNSGLAVLRDRKAEVDDEIREHQGRMWQLWKEQSRLASDEEHMREAYEVVKRAGSSARRLPAELIGEIFLHCVGMGSRPLRHEDRVLVQHLASVSRQFRSIAHSLSALWSNQRFNTNLLDDYPERILHLMQTHGRSPLRLDVDSGLVAGSYQDYWSWWWNEGPPLDNSGLQEKLLAAFATTGVTIDHLRLGYDVVTDISALCSLGQGRLTLALHWRRAARESDDDGTNQQSPQLFSFTESHPDLQTLAIFEDWDSQGPPTFERLVPHHSRLTALHLEHVRIAQVSQWIALASGLPRLETLFLDDVALPLESTRSVIFPFLTHLVAFDSVGVYLSAVCPSLRFLSVSRSDIEAIPSFIERCNMPRKAVMVLSHLGFREPPTCNVKDLLPHLQCLIVLPPIGLVGDTGRGRLEVTAPTSCDGLQVFCSDSEFSALPLTELTITGRSLEDLVDMALRLHPTECAGVTEILQKMFLPSPQC